MSIFSKFSLQQSTKRDFTISQSINWPGRTRFINLNIGAKLIVGLSILVGITLLIIVLSIVAGRIANDSIDQVKNLRVPMVRISTEARSNLLKMMADVRGHLVLNEEGYIEGYKKNKQVFSTNLAELRELSPSWSTPGHIERLNQLNSDLDKWSETVDQLFELHDSPRKNQPALRLAHLEVQPLYASIIYDIDKMVQIQGQRGYSEEDVALLKDLVLLQASFDNMVINLRAFATTGDATLKYSYAVNEIKNNAIIKRIKIKLALLNDNQQIIFQNFIKTKKQIRKLASQIHEAIEGEQTYQSLYLFKTQAVPQAQRMLLSLDEMTAEQQTLLQTELSEGRQQLSKLQVRIFLGGVVALLFGLGLALFFRKIIAKPIQRLTHTAEQVASGDITVTAQVESEDEIGRLAETFNYMTNQLSVTINSLTQHRNHLDELVNERTSELFKSKKMLEWELHVNEALTELANILISPDKSIKKVAEMVLVNAQSLTGSEHGFVSEIDRITHENVGHTLTAMMGNACKVTEPEQRIAFPCGDDGKYPKLWGHALNTGEAFFTNTPQDHHQSSGLPEGHVPLHRFLAVPVKYSGEVIGLIALANPPSDYAKHHVEAIHRLADLYALAIHRHRGEEDRIQIETQLVQAQKMEAIGTLAGGIAHDFNNILAAILGYAEIIKDDLPPESSTSYDINQVLKAGNRAKELVKQILAFSRQSEHELVPVQVHLIVKEALELLRSSIPTTIEIRKDIDPKCGTVLSDVTQIHQIVMNLCTNAYHAMRATGGVLAITLRPIQIEVDDHKVKSFDLTPGSYIELAISDSGVGMDKKTVDKIFDPYFTTKKQGEGTGLGLSVVHGIIKSYGGHISVYSESGEGTTFRLYLPQVKTDITSEKTETVLTLLTGNERALIVDDEEVIVNMVQRMLTGLGYHVTAATSSKMALQAFQKAPDNFDFIITDMTMPNMNGAELIQRIRRIRANLPIILCTGFSELIDQEKSSSLGIQKYLMKPVLKRDLANAVREVLDEQSTEDI